MRYLAILLLLCLANACAAEDAPGTTSASAIAVTLPEFQDNWAFEGRMGQRYTVPIKRVGDTVWYTFKLEDNLVVYAQHFGVRGNNVSVELLDKDLKKIDQEKDETLWRRLIYNGKLKKGIYFLKVVSTEYNGKRLEIELSHFSKQQTEDAERQIKALDDAAKKDVR